MDDFVSKPVSVADLGDALQRAASERFGGSTRPPSSPPERGPSADKTAASGIDATVLAGLSTLLGDRPDELVELLQRFLANARKGVADVDAAIGRRDAKAIYSLAHSMTASAGLVGAEALSGLYAQLMEASQDGLDRGIDAIATAVKNEVGAVERALAGYLGTD